MGLYLTYKLEDQNREKLYEGQIKSFILNKDDETYVEKFINSIREKNFNYSLAILYKRWNKIENEDLKKDLINKITGETGQSSSSKEKTSACQKIINLKENKNQRMKAEIPDVDVFIFKSCKLFSISSSLSDSEVVSKYSWYFSKKGFTSIFSPELSWDS